MTHLLDYAKDTRQIELAIERIGIALGINWADENQVRQLAREALDFRTNKATIPANQVTDRSQLAKMELFGLAGLMLKTMTESAEAGFETHGGDAWKAFGKALIDQSGNN